GLEELLARAEILTLHASLTDGSRGLIGRRELELMPRGSVLVNTARGALIDEQALLEALRSGQLAGAALDTVADERGSGSAALLEHARSNANLLITPHIGGLTHESRHTTEMLMVDQLATYLERRQSPVR
ncbi:MAG: 2-hydroxyacid dehydrogenase, partial [Solirubrobacterales bacterium]